MLTNAPPIRKKLGEPTRPHDALVHVPEGRLLKGCDPLICVRSALAVRKPVPEPAKPQPLCLVLLHFGRLQVPEILFSQSWRLRAYDAALLFIKLRDDIRGRLLRPPVGGIKKPDQPPFLFCQDIIADVSTRILCLLVALGRQLNIGVRNLLVDLWVTISQRLRVPDEYDFFRSLGHEILLRPPLHR